MYTSAIFVQVQEAFLAVPILTGLEPKLFTSFVPVLCLQYRTHAAQGAVLGGGCEIAVRGVL